MNKDILVTGASGVIGHAIVRRLAHAGFRVHLAGRGKARLAPLQDELTTADFKPPVYLLKLADLSGCERVVKDFFRRAKNPFGLVCNAGNLGPVGRFWQVPITAWRRGVAENFLSHTTMIHAFAKAAAHRKLRAGSIAVLSGAGVGSAGDFSKVTSYSVSKAALVHLVEALAPELQALGITINAVAPGPVLSKMTQQTLDAGADCNDGFLEAAQRCMETGGVSPDLAAQLVEFLMSPDARPVSGRLLSARFDQATVRQKGEAISRDAHWYRLRRIDYELFLPKSS